MFCEVYVLDVPYALDRPFDYAVKDGDDVVPGALLKVPFGKNDNLRTGVAVRLKETTDAERVKPVHTVMSDRFTLSGEMLGLCLFLKERTLCTFGEAVKCILPPGALSDPLNVCVRRTYTLTDEAAAQAILSGKQPNRSEGQKEVLRYLLPIGSADAELLRQLPGVTAAHLAALTKKGLLSLCECSVYRDPYAEMAENAEVTPVILSPEQERAYETVETLLLKDEPNAALLYGVTGSGKTKVMIKAIDRTLGMGKSAILLVPEIALTPQTVRIFVSRYGKSVAVIHSMLSKGERLDAYRRIESGEVKVVIGTRSAVFAPLSDLGLIIIDEEHEHTYKSETDPKYHAKDVAAYRCGVHRALMLLASATPSLESYYKAENGNYTLIKLKERYGGAKLPKAYVVDMREELRGGNLSPISERLLSSLQKTEEDGKQAILFLNRRGFNSQISCKTCGEVIKCPRCSVSLTYHAGGRGRMLCHLCGYTVRPPGTCPACGSDKLSYLGFGTQKVEDELAKYLPSCRVLRMDADTTGQKAAYDRMIEDFRQERADILLGTQMVTKGHDFPKVSLTGVILADSSLYVSDFRASERTFSLLTQVIGRAGRAGEGIAVIQTYSPGNEVIRLACEQNYEAFYESEIAVRSALSYPPFCDMVQMTLTSEDEGELKKTADTLKEEMGKLLAEKYGGIPFIVYGPFEAQVYKVGGRFRLRFVVKCKLNAASRRFFAEILEKYGTVRKTTLTVDLNPQTV